MQLSNTTENLTFTSSPSNDCIKIPYKKHRKPANNDKIAKFWDTSTVNSNATSPNLKEHKPGEEAERKPQPQKQTKKHSEIAGQHVLTHIATRVKVVLLLGCVDSATWGTHAL